jgi:hypothetical protein
MVPVFGLPILPITAAMGISIVIYWFTYNHQYDPLGLSKEEKKELSIQKRTYLLSRPVMALLVGYIIKGFM